MNGKRLYRCRQDRQIAGVAGGMAEYLGVDPTVIRILWILSVFLGGFTLLLYLIMAIIVPLEPAGWPGQNPASTGGGNATDPVDPIMPADAHGAGEVRGAGWTPGPAHFREPHTGSGALVFGVLLVVFGTLALLGPVFPGWLAGVHLGPAFLVALGVALLVVALRRPAADR